MIRIQTNSYVVPKRYYVFKQFVNTTPRNSRRVVTGVDTSSLKVTGYLWPDGNTFSIQVINDTASVFNNVFFQCTRASGPVQRHRTSSTLDAAQLPATLTATNNLFIETIPARSFNTFIGVLNSTPVLTAASNRTVNAGITVVATNSATDVDAPPQILNFRLLTPPSGATINSNSGVFTWRPPVAAANSTNPINVIVADNGSPSRSATQSFLVTVNPLNAPVMTLQSSNNGLVRLSVAGDYGPDYTVQATTNLVSWTNVFTTNLPVLPFNWNDPAGTTLPRRFYRAVPGP